MPYGVVLKDERRTSNNDVAPLLAPVKYDGSFNGVKV